EGEEATQRQQAEAQRDKARARSQMAREAIDVFYLQVSENPDLKARGMEGVRRKLLEAAVQYFEQFAHEEDADEPATRAEQGRALMRLGDLLRLLGDSER